MFQKIIVKCLRGNFLNSPFPVRNHQHLHSISLGDPEVSSTQITLRASTTTRDITSKKKLLSIIQIVRCLIIKQQEKDPKS